MSLVDARDADGYVVGIDLGGTKVRAGIAALDASDGPRARAALVEAEEATEAGGGRALVGQIAGLVEGLSAAVSSPVDAVRAIGVGGAGVPAHPHGGFELAPNLGDLASFSLADELRLALGCAVVLENDANVAALGELAAGVGVHHDDFAFISIGTGIGMGLVLDRALVPGAGNAAGEIGYLPFGADPLDPAAHRRGPLEEVVAGDALAARLGAGASARDVFDLAERGDARAVAAIDEEARWVAHAIAAVAAVVDPGRFVLGGGIGSRPELLAPVRTWLARLGRGDLPVTISELGGAAPVLGALHLARAAAGRTHEGVAA
ncbi:ROK family protein [Agromyces kandeliae]|uniref:ROK family protein n=2 Tax=Agromyces TaxID=33877 RepID=A0A6L5QWL7_9MICO|nr:ROK family protein [Agromyces kandeliae]MRX42141.1 ROK family protein [Agromyces kandeliae]